MLLRPDPSCPLFLEGSSQQAGLGHAFLSFAALITLAEQNNLTLRSRWPVGRESHAVNSTLAQLFFFNGYFYPPVTTPNKILVDVKSSESLSTAVLKFQKACNSTNSVIFRLAASPKPRRVAGIDVCGFRHAFEHNPHRSKCGGPGLPTFNITVHIRRGDTTNLTRQAHRWVSNRAYVDVIVGLRERVHALFPSRHVQVILLAEGADAPQRVPDYNGSMTDFTALLHPSPVLLGRLDALGAFDDMCTADILVAGKSGFSHLAALLCKKPMVVFFPSWLPYSFSPQAVPVKTQSRRLPRSSITFVDGGNVDQTLFESAWNQSTIFRRC